MFRPSYALRFGLLGAAAATISATVGCSGGPEVPAECPASPLTAAVIQPDRVLDWEPLGFVNGLSHVFPTDHQYVRVVDPDDPAAQPQTVYAPADVVITQIASGDRGGRTEYDVIMDVCGDVVIELAHLQSFSDDLLHRMGDPVDCETYDPGGGPITKCYRRGAIAVAAGTVLGTVGHPQAPYLDISALDGRHANHFVTARQVPYPRLHAISALDLFTPELREPYAQVVGRYGERRTATPVGGSIEVDLAATAQGHWYLPGAPVMSESLHFALVPDYIDPETRGVASLGESLVPGGGEIRFTYESTGIRNRRPADVTADGQSYCFDDGSAAMLLELTSPTQLRAQYFAASTCADAPVFTDGAVSFER